jgi:hypothetical protein
MVGSCGLEPTPYEDARAKQEFESFFGRPVCIAAVSNMWGPLVSGPQYLGSTADRKLAPEQGFEP